MANTLDMSLDDLIKSRRNNGKGKGRGKSRPDRERGGTLSRGRAAGVLRRGLRVNARPSGYTIAKPSSRTKDFTWKHDLFQDSMIAAGYSAVETGTKLYVSNLDTGVTNEDIKELFSEIGELKRHTVHYDRTGRSSGSAEVVFARKVDALAAMKRYNNVQLDGKAMKIEVIGTNLTLPVALPVSARVNVTGGATGRGKRTVIMTSDFGRGGASGLSSRGTRRSRGGFQRGRGGRAQNGGRGRVRGRGRGRGKTQTTEKSVDDLDKDLESYHAEAMQT